MVVRDVHGAKQEQYGLELMRGITCGSYLTTTESLAIVTGIVEVLCLAHKYLIFELSDYCLEKLKLCPFGTREVAMLLELVVTQVLERKATASLYDFLRDNMRIHRLRLMDCVTFQRLYDIIHTSTISELLASVDVLQAEFIDKATKKGLTVLRFITEVKVNTSSRIYGPNDNYNTKFGSAKQGEVYVTAHPEADQRRIITAANGQDLKIMAYPKVAFEFMKIGSLKRWGGEGKSLDTYPDVE
jgi:hypothetical protein